jgi:hypothetical protein
MITEHRLESWLEGSHALHLPFFTSLLSVVLVHGVHRNAAALPMVLATLFVGTTVRIALIYSGAFQSFLGPES